MDAARQPGMFLGQGAVSGEYPFFHAPKGRSLYTTTYAASSLKRIALLFTPSRQGTSNAPKEAGVRLANVYGHQQLLIVTTSLLFPVAWRMSSQEDMPMRPGSGDLITLILVFQIELRSTAPGCAYGRVTLRVQAWC